MKTRNVVKALTVALLLSQSALAQFQINGTVKNKKGEAIPGASVYIPHHNKGVITDDDGKFVLTVIKSGKIDVVAQQLGYKSQQKTITISQNTTINFKLSTTIYHQKAVDVLGVRASEKTPTTYQNYSYEDIEKMNYGQDIPYLLQKMPSTVITSDAGTGIGYTGFRIRGVDPTRTNITVNGIPVNDAESQSVFWVNMPDFASSISSMQVQRGVGTSSNGAGAFGASINIETNKLHRKPYAILDNSYGSFNTIKNTVSAGTGLLGGHFTLDARLSRIVSDGYVDRASANLKSYYLSGAYFNKKSTLRFIVFSGKEKTYQAWNGIPEGRLYGNETEMLAYASRNGLSPEETERLLTSGRTYNVYTYKNQTDNYQQDHFQLHFNHRFSDQWKMKAALHFTRGRGYYESYFQDEDFSSYNFLPIEVKGDTITSMDMINQDWLNNYFGGGVFYVDYNNNKGLNVTLGGGLNKYYGKHYEYIIWAKYMGNHTKDQKYFDNDASKLDGNVYLKATYQLGDFTLYGDAQYRYIQYDFLGIDNYKGQIINFPETADYHFFNPKFGLSYSINKNQSLYASYAVANREPVRDDFRENIENHRPKPEILYDLEVGYHLNHTKGFLNANVYYMSYKNQLILTGEINDVGGYSRTNVDKSYRLGLEIQGGYQPIKQLGFTANVSLSQNKIINFVEYVDSYDASWNPIPQTAIQYGTTDMAFAPSIIGGLSVNYVPFKGFNISWMHKYVGKQFLDNTSNDTRSIPGFYISHIDISYSFSAWFFKKITIGGRINNLFNTMYASNGYTFSYLVGNSRTQENFYFPQAGINYMLRLRLAF